jgi:hypothetical protein
MKSERRLSKNSGCYFSTIICTSFIIKGQLVFGPQAASMSSPSGEPPSASATEHLQSKEGWQTGPSSMIILKPID